MNEFYITVRSNSANLEVRITTGDNFIRMQGMARYIDDRKNQSVNEAVQLDDPNRNQKLLDLWNTFKTVISNEMSNIFSHIETQVNEYLTNLDS